MRRLEAKVMDPWLVGIGILVLVGDGGMLKMASKDETHERLSR